MVSGMHFIQYGFGPAPSPSNVVDNSPSAFYPPIASPSFSHLENFDYLDDDDTYPTSHAGVVNTNHSNATYFSAAYDPMQRSIWSTDGQNEASWGSFLTAGGMYTQRTVKPCVFAQPRPKRYDAYYALPDLERIASDMTSESAASSESSDTMASDMSRDEEVAARDESPQPDVQPKITSLREWIRQHPSTGNHGPDPETLPKPTFTIGSLKRIGCFFHPSELRSHGIQGEDPRSTQPPASASSEHQPSSPAMATLHHVEEGPDSEDDDGSNSMMDWDELSFYTASEGSDVDDGGYDGDDDTRFLTPPPRPSHETTIRKLAQLMGRNV